MASEIATVKKSVGKPVEVIDDTASTYVNLRDHNKDIDVVYRIAVRATAGSNGLMELALACPGGMTTESDLLLELTDGMSTVYAP